jgi:hypothetical protein
MTVCTQYSMGNVTLESATWVVGGTMLQLPYGAAGGELKFSLEAAADIHLEAAGNLELKKVATM